MSASTHSNDLKERSPKLPRILVVSATSHARTRRGPPRQPTERDSNGSNDRVRHSRGRANSMRECGFELFFCF